MGRVRGHRRKAYRRKDGTRVRATQVRSHYRRNRGHRTSPRRRRGRRQTSLLGSLVHWLGSTAREANDERQRTAHRQAVYHQEQVDWRHRQAATAAESVCARSWQGRITQHLGAAVDKRDWAPRLHRCSIEECLDLADLAEALLDFHSIARLVPGDLLYRRRMDRAPQSFQEQLAHELYAMSSAPARVGMVKAAKCIQVIGILCCLTAERDLEDCQCLQDFSHDLAMDQLETELVRMAQADSWPQPNS